MSSSDMDGRGTNDADVSSVLLIEPDRVLAETYRQALLSAGHVVVCCASAQAGIISADQHRPDLIILELQLVEHSGIEFLYELRSYADWQDIPVVIQTIVPPAEFNATRKLLCERLGVCFYLYKPAATLGELIKVVDENLPDADAVKNGAAAAKMA